MADDKSNLDNLTADVIVVGSGVVGGLIATKLAASGLKVIVLEAGPWIKRADVVEGWRNIAFYNRTNSDYQSIYKQSPMASAPLYFPPNNYMKLSGPNGEAYAQGYLRVVGGTTWHWAASSWRHLPVDFQMKSTYGVGRDWPFDYGAIEPFYDLAEKEMGVSGPHDKALQSPPERSQPYPRDMIPFGYGDQRFADIVNPHGFRSVPIPQGRTIEPYEDRPACCGNNNCQPICPIGAMYNGIHHVQKAQGLGVEVVSEAVVYKADTDEQNRLTAVYWYDREKKSHKATAKAFVFACNGIEAPRLMLLAANERNPKGLGNSSDQVGRNMMDHCGLHVDFVAKEPLWIGRGPAQSSCMVGFRDGSFRSEHSANKVIINNISRVPSATKAALKMGLTGKALAEEVRRRSICSVDLSISFEPLPDPNNRLTLSADRRDGLGLACPDIYYDVGDYVRRGAAACRKQMEDLAKLFDATEFTMSEKFNANNHIMGGAIMGNDPKTSVTNADGRTHDHENLFVPGGATMCSASVVNTTLTMAALALKAVEPIKSYVAGAEAPRP